MEETCKICNPCKHINSNSESTKIIRQEDIIENMANFYKAIGDKTRLSIVIKLLDGRTCVCDIAASLDMTQSAISHQLKILRLLKLVKATRIGREMFYELTDDHVENIIRIGIEHICEKND